MMQTEVFVDILRKIKGIEDKDGVYTLADGWDMTVHLGSPGRALVVRKVRAVRIDGPLITLDSTESGSIYCTCSDVSVVTAEEAMAARGARAGFG
ncbi:MAG: hypothetical protein H6714_07535 [Myxococcales bacterium]|nr:hypothetical protein [Myxococcales bacterium]